MHFSYMILHLHSCYAALLFVICIQNLRTSCVVDYGFWIFYISSSICFLWSQSVCYSWKYFSYWCHHPCSNPVWGSWNTVYLRVLERSKLNLYSFKCVFFSVLLLVTICSFLELWTCIIVLVSEKSGLYIPSFIS